MPTRIVKTATREYEVAQIGEIQKVFCRELRLLEPGPELEAVLGQMKAEDEHARKQAQENGPTKPPPDPAPKHRKQRSGRKRRHR